jgi:hypothetical protein
MPTIEIELPPAGGTVNQSFVASGTWTNGARIPLITVILQDSSGTTVATGSTTADPGGTWTSSFTLSQGYTDATLVASYDGTPAVDSHGGITVT